MEFIVNRTEWLRGEPGSLYDSSRCRLCIMGHICEQLGVPRDEMEGLGDPESLPSMYWSLFNAVVPPKHQAHLMQINDNPELTDAQRVVDIAHELSQCGHTLRVVS